MKPGRAPYCRRRRGGLEQLSIAGALTGLAAAAACNPTCPWAASAWALAVGGWRVGERLLWTITFSALLALVFWAANLAFWAADRFLSSYRIVVPQPPPSRELLRETVQGVLLDQLVVRPLLLYAVFPLFRAAGMLIEAEALPTLRQLLFQLLICSQVDDALFYWFHRGLHHPRVYRHIHKQHHTFKHTVGVATEYAHPVEGALNAVATVAGPLVLGGHMAVCMLYAALKLWQSIDAHSGFDLPFPLSPWSIIDVVDCAPAHSFHHSHNHGMYGGYTVFWDWLCGTDRPYRAYEAKCKAANSKIA